MRKHRNEDQRGNPQVIADVRPGYRRYIDGLVQDCSNSSALAME